MTFSYFFLISRDATGQMFLVETPHGLALPELGFQDSNRSSQYVRRFNLFIAEQLGLNVISVGKFRWLARPDRGAGWLDRFYGFELQSSERVSVSHTWLGSADLKNARLTDPNHGPIIEAWFQSWQNGPVSDLAAPWRSPGWYHGAEEWIRHKLVALGLAIVGDIEQIIVWDRSTILRVPTDAGNLYFKACPSAARQGVRVTKWLADRLPLSLPTLVAADEDCQWMLSRDYGRILRDELESLSEPQKVDKYSEAVGEYARVQTATLSHVAELLELGCPDRRLNVIAQEYSALIDYAETLNQRENNLISPLGFAHLRDLAGHVESRCEQLDRILIPPALEHGDLHANQIAMRDGNYVFTDWSDCSISHPFFSLPPALHHDLQVFVDREAARSSAVRAYLEMWSQFATQDELRLAYDLAEPLAFIHRAMLYQRLVSLVDDGSDWERNVVGYLSQALNRMR